ncbi:MAG: NHL repeat-containing protein [Polyangiaceae bacterium]|nr:NHL repeat-containing protein [Polyangiaceae bacterium]
MHHIRGLIAFAWVAVGCTGFDLPQQDASTNLYVVSTLAGTGKKSNSDGPGLAATFVFPTGVAVGSDGNLYVADDSTIRKITVEGTVSTYAGTGDYSYVNGDCSTATFNGLNSIATDKNGNIYVAENENNSVRKITAACQVSTLAGSPTGTPGDADGSGSDAAFRYPGGLAIDDSGNVYVADCDNNKIRMITSDGVVTTIAGKGKDNYGHTDGATSIATFNCPFGIAVDMAGTVYVAEADNNVIRKISDGMVSTLAGSGDDGPLIDGSGVNAHFNDLGGLVLGADGNLYVADSDNNAVRKISPAGDVVTVAGTGAAGANDGSGNVATFFYPWALTLDTNGVIYVADSKNYKIRKITPPAD